MPADPLVRPLALVLGLPNHPSIYLFEAIRDPRCMARDPLCMARYEDELASVPTLIGSKRHRLTVKGGTMEHAILSAHTPSSTAYSQSDIPLFSPLPPSVPPPVAEPDVVCPRAPKPSSFAQCRTISHQLQVPIEEDHSYRNACGNHFSQHYGFWRARWWPRVARIADDVGLAEGFLLWAASVYVLSAGCLLLVFGAVADVVGAKPVWVTGSFLYVVFMVAVGLSKTGVQIILFRTFLGLSSASAWQGFQRVRR